MFDSDQLWRNSEQGVFVITFPQVFLEKETGLIEKLKKKVKLVWAVSIATGYIFCSCFIFIDFFSDEDSLMDKKYQVQWLDQSNLSMDPLAYKSAHPNPAKANGKSSKTNRSIAAEGDPIPFVGPGANDTTEFINIANKEKLVIWLDFYCTGYLYLYEARDVGAAEANRRKCIEIAKAGTMLTNLVFENSQIPVVFKPTFQVEMQNLGNPTAGVWDKLGAYTYSSQSVIDKSITRNYDPLNLSTSDLNGRLNADTRFKNWDVFPNVFFTNYSAALTYIPPVYSGGTPPIVTVDPSTCNPFYPFNPTQNCNSTVPVITGNAFWSGRLPSYPGSCGSSLCQSYSSAIAPLSGWFGGFSNNGAGYVCNYSCHCTHLSGNVTAWNSMCRSSWGAWPGSFYDNNRNACGCVITTMPGTGGTVLQPEYWMVNNSTRYNLFSHIERFASIYETAYWAFMSDALYGIKKGHLRIRGYNSYGSRMKNRRITVVVKLPNISDTALGIAAGVADPLKKTVTEIVASSSGNSIEGINVAMPEPDQYLPKYGALVFNAYNNFGFGVLAHEIGHILGGQHETSSILDPVQRQHNIQNKIGAYIDPNNQYATIMRSNADNLISYFSTRKFKSTDGLKLGTSTTDNRAQIIRMVNYLAKKRLALPSIEDEAKVIQVINSVILKKNLTGQ